MIAFAMRNLKLYFRDRSAVFVSLLAVLIEIGLYVLFLGDVYTNDLSMFEKAREMMDHWVMAGVLATTGVTTSLVILGNIVKDRESRKIKDFIAAPVRNSRLLMGYWLSAYVLGLGMSLFTLVIAEIYIVWNGGQLLSLEAMIKVAGFLGVTNLTSTAMMLCLVVLFHTSSAFAMANTILGTAIGFLTGIYLPIGMYPSGVQWLVRLFPVSHAASLFRQMMMEDVMNESFSGIPSDIVLSIKEYFGILYNFGGKTMSAQGSFIFLILSASVCYLFAWMIIKRK